MKKMEPNIQIPVDLTNPGQFFACCGLLELASRIDSNTLGCFDGSRFYLQTEAIEFLDEFFKCSINVETSVHSSNTDDGEDGDTETGEDSHRGRVFPMILDAPFNMRLDWWMDDEAQGQKLKLWTAGQRVTDLLLGHHKNKKTKKKGQPERTVKVYTPSTREHFAEVVQRYPDDWLRIAIPIVAPAAFSFDSRLSRNNALDLGHFPHGTLAFSPAIDVLCLVAFQRFRPRMIEEWNRNLYCTWCQPLPVIAAPLAAIGMFPSIIGECFEFPIKARDSQGRFKLFGHAQPSRRPNV